MTSLSDLFSSRAIWSTEIICNRTSIRRRSMSPSHVSSSSPPNEFVVAASYSLGASIPSYGRIFFRASAIGDVDCPRVTGSKVSKSCQKSAFERGLVGAVSVPAVRAENSSRFAFLPIRSTRSLVIESMAR